MTDAPWPKECCTCGQSIMGVSGTLSLAPRVGHPAITAQPLCDRCVQLPNPHLAQMYDAREDAKRATDPARGAPECCCCGKTKRSDEMLYVVCSMPYARPAICTDCNRLAASLVVQRFDTMESAKARPPTRDDQDVHALLKEREAEIQELKKPIAMRLLCPECGQLHIDEGEFATKPHHTHSCQHCGLTWRPAVVPTVGVRFLPGFKNESTS